MTQQCLPCLYGTPNMMPELCKIKARCGSVPLSCLGLVWVTSTVRCILQPFHEWVDPWDSIEVYKIKNDSSFLTPNYVALISISGLIYIVLDIIYLFINIHVYTYLHTFKVFTEDLFLMYPCACLYASVYGLCTWAHECPGNSEENVRSLEAGLTGEALIQNVVLWKNSKHTNCGALYVMRSYM